MWSFFLEWKEIHDALAKGIGWIPRQGYLNFYNLPGAKVTITFLIFIATRWGEKPATSPAIPETTPLLAGLHASVVQNIFYYILSALFQGRGMPLAVKWVRKPKNAALVSTSSCCESAESLILSMNQHWQWCIKGTDLTSETMSPKTQGITTITWQLKSILFHHRFPLLCLGKLVSSIHQRVEISGHP